MTTAVGGSREAGLRTLVGYLGPDMVAEGLGIDAEGLALLLDGRGVLGPDAAQNYDRLVETLGDFVPAVSPPAAPAEPSPPPAVAPAYSEAVPAPPRAAPSPLPPQTGPAGFSGGLMEDIEGAGLPALPGRTGFTPAEEDERRRINMRKARTYAQMAQFRLGMDYEEWLLSVALLAKTELTLIYCYGESVPEPGEMWDARRREREKDRRMSRLRWAQEELAKSRRGASGIWKRLLGKEQVSGRELFDKMVRDVDEMLGFIDEGLPATVMDDARDFAALMR